MLRFSLIFLPLFASTYALPPPPPPPPISDEEEVTDNEDEDVDDTDADADDADADTTVDDAAPEDTDYATMPPRLVRKPPTGAKKATKKAESKDVAEVPPPAAKPPVNYSVDSTDNHLVAYYVKGNTDVADVVFFINGVVRDTEYRVTVAADRKSISWTRAVHSICFSKKILKAILGGKYSSSSHRAVAYDDIAQEMQGKNIRPENHLFWGAPQVVRLKWECTGAFKIVKRDYEINYVNVDSRDRKNRQCNSVLIVQVKKAKERAATEAKVNKGQMSLFGSFSQGSPGSSGNPPSPPPRRKSPRLSPPVAAAAGHRVDEEDDNDDNERFGSSEDDDDDDDGGGEGEGGGGYGSDGGGKRKRRY
jgi:hypothetical protein